MSGMSPDEFQNYLGLLSRLLRLRTTEREAIEEELRVHLEERFAALSAQGIEPKRAVSMALAEFGDAAALAAEFAAVIESGLDDQGNLRAEQDDSGGHPLPPREC